VALSAVTPIHARPDQPKLTRLINVCTDPTANNTGASASCSYSSSPPTTCTDPKAENTGGKLPCTYQYKGINSNLLISNNAAAAHAEGFTGKGVRVGIVDTAFDHETISHLDVNYVPLNGKVLSYDTWLADAGWKHGFPNLHSLLVAVNLGGQQTGDFAGGIAPEVQFRWFGICDTGGYCQVKDNGGENWPLSYRIDPILSYGDVRLINVSLGGGGGFSLLDTDPYWVPIYRERHSKEWGPLLKHDVLVVGAGGNDGKEHPGTDWQIPLLNPEFYGHFIVAMALHVIPEDWNDSPWSEENLSEDPRYKLYRASYSNACGVTKEWCVGAIANTTIPAFRDPNQPLYGLAGTSVAAPIITGVATLVLEAYPWMSALNVQQTVLTTATDMGKPGVDEIYGWGLVNAAKAIHGPAQFVKNRFIDGFIADFDGGSRPFNNDINGAGWLKKRGNGTLTLTGNNSYTGGTFVEAGTLRSSGSFGSDVNVAPGATFMTLYDANSQKPNKAVTINGNYTVHSDTSWNADKPASEHKTGIATTAIQLGAPLEISGKADIGNDNRLLLLRENQGYSVSSSETLITADQGLIGRFSEFSYGSHFFWSATLNYTNRSLIADLRRTTSAQSQAQATNTSAQVIDGAGMADALISYTDKLVESGQTTGHEALLSATAKLMSAPDDAAAMQSLSSLTGEIHGAARALGIQRAFDSSKRLAERLHTLGSQQPTGVWLQNAVNNGQFSRPGYADAEVQYSTTGIGADAAFGERWLLGISAARTTSNAHLDGFGGRLSGIGQQLAVYAHTHLGDQGYFSSVVSFDQHAVDTQRQVLAGDTLSQVSGQHIDNTTLFRLESGLNLKSGFTPYFATGALSLRQSGFTESGMLGLSVGTDTFTAEFAEIGTRFDRHVGRWTLAANTSVRRLFGNENGFNATFAGAEAAPFTVTGQPFTGADVRMGSNVSYQTVNGWQLTLGLGTKHNAQQKRNTWSEATAKMRF